MASNSTDVGDRIRIARERAGLTQAELAHQAGLRQQSVAKWEAGLSSPSASSLASIARALRTSTDGLLGLEEITIDASGADLGELRERDPEAYEAIIAQARIALDRARARRRR